MAGISPVDRADIPDGWTHAAALDIRALDPFVGWELENLEGHYTVGQSR